MKQLAPFFINQKLMIMKIMFVSFMILLTFYNDLFAIVKYDEGSLTIDGVQLLQDKDQPNQYYYLPQYPRIARKPDGSLDLLCMKYVGQGGLETNGGIFHALVSFTLPEEVITDLRVKLRAIIPDGEIAGVVPLMNAAQDGEDGVAAFSIVSAILNNTEGVNSFTKRLITSGHAPLRSRSKAAIAANLNQAGVTLLWESLQGNTSDVSVALNGYYEAAIKAYQVKLTAEVSAVYEHYSRLISQQDGFSKEQLRKISDELLTNRIFNIEMFDRTGSLGLNADELDVILNLMTDKIVEIMFDPQTIFVEKEVGIEQGQVEGRQKRGWFSKVFGGARDEKYVSDDQYVLKERSDIQLNTFFINLNKETTVKIPFYAAGNIGGAFYDSLETDDRYFQIVDMYDPGFQKREVRFVLDNTFVESVDEVLSTISVSFRKKRDGAAIFTEEISFTKETINNGLPIQKIIYARLGTEGTDWLDYEYKVRYDLNGNGIIEFPEEEGVWFSSKSPIIVLRPPLTKRILKINTDKKQFDQLGIYTGEINFLTFINKKPQFHKSVYLQSGESEGLSTLSLYHDSGRPIIYQVIWHTKEGILEMPYKQLKGNFLFLNPTIDLKIPAD